MSDIWLVFIGISFYILPLIWLERAENQYDSPIQKISYSDWYGFLERILMIAFLAGLVFLARYDIYPLPFICLFFVLNLLTTGLYASYTGKYPNRTRNGMQYFFTNYSGWFFDKNVKRYGQRLTVRFMGTITIFLSIVYAGICWWWLYAT